MNLFFIIVLSLIENVPALETGDCDSWLFMSFCGGKQEFIPISRTTPTEFHAYYLRGNNCLTGDLQFDWEIFASDEPVATRDHVFPNYIHQGHFILEPYSFGTGYYGITVFEKIDNVRQASSSCKFEIITEMPVPIIEGGSERIVENDKAFEVNGGKSTDRNVRSGIQGLKFKWSCERKMSKGDNFCDKPIKNESYVIVPKEYATDGQIYTFELTVGTKDLESKNWVSTKQTVIVTSHSTILNIRCLKNCPLQVLKTNSKEKTILQVNCVKNCEYTNVESYVWSVNSTNFDYNTDTEGRNSDTFIINENVLKPGIEYLVTFEREDTTGISFKISKVITVHQPPTLENCHLNPKTGKAFITNFVAECKFSGKGPYRFLIYSLESDDTEILLHTGHSLESMKFILGSTTKVKIVIVDNFHFSGSKTADVSVESGLNAKGTEEETQQYLETVFYDKNSQDSLENLSDRKKYKELMQGINSMTDVLNTIVADKPDVVKEYQLKNLQLLQKVPVDSLIFAEYVMGIANKIANQQKDSSDPDVARLALDLCLKSSVQYNALLKQERYAGSFSEPAVKISQTAAKCSQASTRLNTEFLNEYNVMYNTTESNITSDIADVEVITENYPDYIDESDPKYENTTKKIEGVSCSSHLLD